MNYTVIHQLRTSNCSAGSARPHRVHIVVGGLHSVHRVEHLLSAGILFSVM